MKGYWHRPEDTAAAFTKDGWLKTGDVGEFNADGMLKIKGRIKEIIVTSTGEKFLLLIWKALSKPIRSSHKPTSWERTNLTLASLRRRAQ